MSKRKISEISGNTKRHVILSDEDIAKKANDAKNKNTENQNKRADKAFRRFLTEADCSSLDYWLFEESELDNYLAKFWHGVRKEGVSDINDQTDEDIDKKTRKYTVASMKAFWYALNRVLKQKGHFYDITDKKGLSFRKSQSAFDTVLKESLKYILRQKSLKMVNKIQFS